MILQKSIFLDWTPCLSQHFGLDVHCAASSYSAVPNQCATRMRGFQQCGRWFLDRRMREENVWVRRNLNMSWFLAEKGDLCVFGGDHDAAAAATR